MPLALLLTAVFAAAPAQEAPAPDLALTGVGRFAIFADLASITPDGDGVRMRSLQISEEDMMIGGVAYVGGWSWWRFDCAARTADRLDFASLRADGTEGPATLEAAPPYPIAPGGDADELAAVACGETAPPAAASSAAEAVRLGRARMTQDAPPLAARAERSTAKRPPFGRRAGASSLGYAVELLA